MIYFTADTHFGHKNIIRYCNRPFTSVQEMNEEIIERWNSVVDNNDVVYHLGDFAFGNANKFLHRLNGKIIRIKGDHDHDIREPLMMRIRKCEYFIDEYGNPRALILCHYSMRSWYKSHYASYALFGHHHGSLEPYGLSFDVGVDTNNFYPYSVLDIEEKMKKLKPIVDFRRSK